MHIEKKIETGFLQRKLCNISRLSWMTKSRIYLHHILILNMLTYHICFSFHTCAEYANVDCCLCSFGMDISLPLFDNNCKQHIKRFKFIESLGSHVHVCIVFLSLSDQHIQLTIYRTELFKHFFVGIQKKVLLCVL